MKLNLTYIFATLLLIVASFAYRHYTESEEQREHDDIVRTYLVNAHTLAQTKKPFLWVHTTFEPNARHWVDFGSRKTTHMNQPYKFMTIKSIIDHCADDFNICLLNDDSFAKVVPGWRISMENVADPLKSKIRRMGLIKLMRQYGGVVVPDSFVCFKSLAPLLEDKEVLCGGTTDLFAAAPPQHEVIRTYANWLEHSISTDYTADAFFRKEPNELSRNIPDSLLGMADASGSPVTLDRLMGSSFVKISPDAYGVYIPEEQLLRSTKYQWFARLSVEQVLESNTMAGKLILLNTNVTT